MPPYLFNKRANIDRDISSIDAYGGVVVTGTSVYVDLPCRLDHYTPRQAQFLEQGMETIKGYTFIFHYNWQNPLDIRENDIIQLIFPVYDISYNKRFRVYGINSESGHPASPYNILECYCVRIERSRGVDSI